mmetsp:Transcript_81951/g.154616  ORF Transcript_81951/g.154616 Transcript_81951/m.154616 type:complete len:88 (+) Transcript_81951:34-297(+)
MSCTDMSGGRTMSATREGTLRALNLCQLLTLKLSSVLKLRNLCQLIRCRFCSAPKLFKLRLAEAHHQQRMVELAEPHASRVRQFASV